MKVAQLVAQLEREHPEALRELRKTLARAESFIGVFEGDDESIAELLEDIRQWLPERGASGS